MDSNYSYVSASDKPSSAISASESRSMIFDAVKSYSVPGTGSANTDEEKNSYCTNCGTVLPEGTKFCLKCGQKVGFVNNPDVINRINQYNAEIKKKALKKNYLPVIVASAVIAVLLISFICYALFSA